MVARITSPGMSRKFCVEFAHQHDRPFDQPRDLVQQAVVLDQFQPLREGEVLAVMQDDVAAARRIEHHFGGAERGQVIVEAAHLDRLRREEAMAVGDIAGLDAADLERHDVRVFRLRPEGREYGMQRAHPAQAIRLGGMHAPAHRLGPRKTLDDRGQDLRQHVERRRARALDQRDIELAALLVRFDLRLVQRGQARALQKTLHGGVGRADARPLLFLALVGLAHRQADDMQGQPARRDKAFRRLIGQAAFEQSVGDELFQVGGRLGLHPGRDFLGEKFEQKVGHDGLSENDVPAPQGAG